MAYTPQSPRPHASICLHSPTVLRNRLINERVPVLISSWRRVSTRGLLSRYGSNDSLSVSRWTTNERKNETNSQRQWMNVCSRQSRTTMFNPSNIVYRTEHHRYAPGQGIYLKSDTFQTAHSRIFSRVGFSERIEIGLIELRIIMEMVLERSASKRSRSQR